MKGKPQSIDLLKLYAQGSTNGWNEFLSDCARDQNLAKLEQVLYGIQLGMNDLAKQKLNTDKVNEWFVRLQRSIENTMKSIIKAKRPNPMDNPLGAKSAEALAEKRARDQEVERYLRRVRF